MKKIMWIVLFLLIAVSGVSFSQSLDKVREHFEGFKSAVYSSEYYD